MSAKRVFGTLCVYRKQGKQKHLERRGQEKQILCEMWQV
jgi:hypothetical protein